MRTLIKPGRTIAVIARPITQDRATTICHQLGLPITADLTNDRTVHLRARGQVSTADEVRAMTALRVVTDAPIHWHGQWRPVEVACLLCRAEDVQLTHELCDRCAALFERNEASE